jgi:hypothetical protein
MMFRPDQLSVIGGRDGFFASLRRRANQVPGEEWIENLDGPQPVPVYAHSASKFRKRYFGQ